MGIKPAIEGGELTEQEAKELTDKLQEYTEKYKTLQQEIWNSLGNDEQFDKDNTRFGIPVGVIGYLTGLMDAMGNIAGIELAHGMSMSTLDSLLEATRACALRVKEEHEKECEHLQKGEDSNVH